jgi:hypothetical protein
LKHTLFALAKQCNIRQIYEKQKKAGREKANRKCLLVGVVNSSAIFSRPRMHFAKDGYFFDR